jgi:NADPH-dependent 2,4-dienoyl-CoA reductase/sulfur reductase-like enzyme
MNRGRRDFLRAAAAGAAAAGFGGLAGCTGARRAGHVVVIGGGFGGATAAKYLRLWSAGSIDVTLVERQPRFVSLPMSNLVIAGERQIEDISFAYDGMKKHGVRVIQGNAVAIDPARRSVRLADGSMIGYDRLVVAPGIDFMWEGVPGLSAELADGKLPHAWQAGAQTIALRRQIEAMPEGGVVAICIPRAPYRCPTAPYERACLVAHYCKSRKPRAKVLVLDANDDVQAQRSLFMAAWTELYPSMIEYRPGHSLSSVDAANGTLRFEYRDALKADVINLVPPQRAGDIARQAGLVTANKRWCGVDWRTMESVVHPGIHVLGSATLAAPQMPKSAHMANQHAKIAAGAITALMGGMPPPEPITIAHAGYSFFDARSAAHVASVHAYDARLGTYRMVPDAGGFSATRSEGEGKYAWAWARGLWADTLL